MPLSHYPFHGDDAETLATPTSDWLVQGDWMPESELEHSQLTPPSVRWHD